MDSFVKENTWLPRSQSFRDFGWGNGYVAIPKGHPLHGKDYDEIHDLIPSLAVHGRLTFSEIADDLKWEELPENSKGAWVVGFDTAHYSDTLERWSKEAVIKEAEKLKSQLAEYVSA